MNTYNVVVTVSTTVCIDAESPDDAIEKVSVTTSARSLSSAATDMLRKSTGMVAVSTSKL